MWITSDAVVVMELEGFVDKTFLDPKDSTCFLDCIALQVVQDWDVGL